MAKADKARRSSCRNCCVGIVFGKMNIAHLQVFYMPYQKSVGGQRTEHVTTLTSDPKPGEGHSCITLNCIGDAIMEDISFDERQA
jgi:hypothetical protein